MRRETDGALLVGTGVLDDPRAEMPNGEALREWFARGFVTPALRYTFCGFVAMQGRKACQTPIGFPGGSECQTCDSKNKKPPNGGFLFLVEHRGFEPLTPTLPVLCAPNCANAPKCPLMASGSGAP